METKIENFLSELSTEIDVLSLIDIDCININDPFGSIYEMINNNGGFDIDIIYYSRAMEYLKENDPSLHRSLELASDMGYTPDNLDSEILASLLASENVRKEFTELEDEINDFFANLENDFFANLEEEEED